MPFGKSIQHVFWHSGQLYKMFKIAVMTSYEQYTHWNLNGYGHIGQLILQCVLLRISFAATQARSSTRKSKKMFVVECFQKIQNI